MNKLILGLLTVAVAFPAAPVMAQRDRGWSDQQREQDGRANQNRSRRSDESDRWNNGRHRGWGHDRGNSYRWGRGQQMGYNDWNSARRVDYRRYNLRQPPRGYEWRRNDDRFILGAIATGLIMSVILSSGR